MKILTSLKESDRSFSCSPLTIRAVLNDGWDAPKPRGRHSVMSSDAEFDVLNWIQNNWEKTNPVPRTDIRHYCKTRFVIPITGGWVDSFISPHGTTLIETRSPP
jgi:hypothetical protein